MMAMQYGNYSVTDDGLNAEVIELMRESIVETVEQIQTEKPGSVMVSAHIIVKAEGGGFPATVAWKVDMHEPGEPERRDVITRNVTYPRKD